jgi:hypothetical protein
MVTDYTRQTVIQKPSRFVTECPAELYDIWKIEEEIDDVLMIEEKEPHGYIN